MKKQITYILLVLIGIFALLCYLAKYADATDYPPEPTGYMDSHRVQIMKGDILTQPGYNPRLVVHTTIYELGNWYLYNIVKGTYTPFRTYYPDQGIDDGALFKNKTITSSMQRQ